MSELNKYPTQEVWGKKKENKPKENRKLDMKLEEVNSWYHQNANSNNSLLQIITQYMARK